MTAAHVTEANRRLSPTQQFVYQILREHPYGACRRTFAVRDVWEVSNRISEIEQRLGFKVLREACQLHPHRRGQVVLYRLPARHWEFIR